MTISVPPKGNSAKELNSYFAPLKVEAQLVVDMTVTITSGSFWTATGEHIEYVGGSSPIITASGADAKWVAITLTESGVINVIDGAESTNPQMPTIPQNELILAGIFMGDTTTAIYADMVFDLRPLWKTHSDLATDLSPYYTMVQTDNLLNVKADMVGTTESTFTLNSDHVGVPGDDVTIVANRGTSLDTSIRWDETLEKWRFTNDGLAWGDLGADVSALYLKVGGADGNITVFGAGDVLADSGVVIADLATAADGALAVTALQDVVDDLTPQLGGMLDVNTFGIGDGTLELVTFTETALAVNELNITNAVTGAGPIVGATGDDVDIDININPKGVGILKSGGTVVSLAGDNISTFTNDSAFTDDATVATNHYTKTLSDDVTGTAGAKIDKIVGTLGYFAEHDGSGELQTGSSTSADFTNDATVATNHYTKTLSDDVTGTAGAKIDKIAGTLGYFAEHDGSGELQTGSSTSADFATTAQGSTADTALQDVADDLNPQLGGMLDVNTFGIGDGTREIISFVEDGTAVNNVEIENESVGAGPIIRAAGDDVNIDINVNPKGLGLFKSGGVIVSLAGDNISTFTNDSAFTDDATVATNHYTKTDSDDVTGTAGAKVDKVAGVSGNVVEFGAVDAINDSGTALSSLAPLTDPVFIGKPVMPTYTVASLPVHVAGGMIYVNDAAGSTVTGSICFSNGTTWVDVTTGAAVV